MAKNMKPKKFEEEFEDHFDFSGSMIAQDEDFVAGVMSDLIAANNHQMVIALELAKLAIEKSTSGVMNEEKVFSAFRQASKVVAESFPLKELFEKRP